MTANVNGVSLRLSQPDETSCVWIGQDEPMRQLLAAWYVMDAADLPMNPRLVGKPGAGKTTLAYAAARRLEREAYIQQVTGSTGPEELLLSLEGIASPLLTAAIRGGICILDEANRMSEKSWACLAPLLDSRGYVEAPPVPGKIRAHPLFRLVVTMNDDASTFDLPEYIHSRLQPQILVDFPDRVDEFAILRDTLPFADDQILDSVIDFLQRAHAADERFTVRDGINTARYAMKLKTQAGLDRRTALRTAFVETLGPEALRHAKVA